MSSRSGEIEKLGDRLREVRLARGLSQAELARQLSALGYRVSQPSVGEYERGGVMPPASYVAGFADVLRVSPSWILWGDGQRDEPWEHREGIVYALLEEVVTSSLGEAELCERLTVCLALLREPSGTGTA